MDNTQAERFKYMRKELLKLSQQQLADILNISQRIIAFIETGRKQKLDTNLLYELKKEYGICTDWLLFGEGTPTELDKNEDNNTCLKNIVKIPFYTDIKASAGRGESIPDEELKEFMYFDERYLKNIIGVNPNNLTVIQAKGDSMMPLIDDGDLLMVDVTNKLGNNGIYVIRQDDSELRVKKLNKDFNGNLQIISENPKYKTETYNNTVSDCSIEIIGKVVWNGNKECV